MHQCGGAITEKADQAYQRAARLCEEAKQSGACALAFPLGCWLLELPPELRRLTSLQSLDLRGCVRINDLEPLAALTSLKFLNLFGCRQISDLKPLATLTSLQSLNLSGCRQISDFGPLAELISLQALNLSRCVQIASLKPFAALASLRFIDLSGCPQISGLEIAALPSLDEKSRAVHAMEGVEALYRAGHLILLVKLAEVRASSWDARLQLTPLQQFATGLWMPSGDFSVSGSLEGFSPDTSEWHIGGILFFNTHLIEEAKRLLGLPERQREVEKLIHRHWFGDRH